MGSPLRIELGHPGPVICAKPVLFGLTHPAKVRGNQPTEFGRLILGVHAAKRLRLDRLSHGGETSLDAPAC